MSVSSSLSHLNLEERWKYRQKVHTVFERYGIDEPKKVEQDEDTSSRVSRFFRNHCYFVFSLGSKAYDFCSNLYPLVSSVVDVAMRIFDGLRSASEVFSKICKPFQKVVRVLRECRVVSFIAAPIALIQLGISVNSLFHSKTFDRAIECGLQLGCAVAWLADSIGTFVGGLESLGAVAAKVANVAVNALGYITLIFLVASVALNIKLLYDNRQFSKELDNDINTLKTSDQEKLEKNLGVTIDEEFPLKDYFQKMNDEDLIRSEEIAKDRVNVLSACHSINLAAAIITMVGIAVMLFTPAAPVGFALLGISAGIGLIALVVDYRSKLCFKEKIQELANPEPLPQDADI